MTKPTLAVVGAGWAGIAAAVRGTQAGFAVSLFEMASDLGGRARCIDVHGQVFDYGQHILVGAYARCLDLMTTVGVACDKQLMRLPLTLQYPDGAGLHLPAHAGRLGAAMAIAGFRGWPWSSRAAMLVAATAWAVRGFRCPAHWTVDDLCWGLTEQVRRELIDPLCLSALNTAPTQASARVFLRVLQDTLSGPIGSSDLLIPSCGLQDLLAAPAQQWLQAQQVSVRKRHRVKHLERSGAMWRVDAEDFDGVVLACSCVEAARLTADIAPQWSTSASALQFESLITVYLQAAGAALPGPMLALRSDTESPAQFAFDHGKISARPGQIACVISAAQAWVDRGTVETTRAVKAQMQLVMQQLGNPATLEVVATLAEKRATFSCTAGLLRPSAVVANGLIVAGDYIEGPYPATLEGAVRSGESAIAQMGRLNG